MDRITAEQRSRVMRAVRSRDTGPELEVRRRLHAAGLRFRANVRGLPGTPDVVLAGRGAVVFVHGCFWHGHSCSRVPDSDRWREMARALLLAGAGLGPLAGEDRPEPQPRRPRR